MSASLPNNYGFPLPYSQSAPKTIVSTTSPTTAQWNYPLGQIWINKTLAVAYILASKAGRLGTWVVVSDATSGITTLTAGSGGALGPVAGNLNIFGTANQIATAGSGNTVTLSLVGPYTPATYTAHGVLIGEGTSSIVATAAGTDGQVLTGNTGADPTFNAIGTKSGLTLNGILLGGGAGPFTATSAGLAGQVLTSNGASPPTFQSSGAGAISYANFFALMPGDNAATVAVGAAIELPQNGPTSGTTITRLTATTFQLASIGTYNISFQCSFDEAGQMMLKLDAAELAQTVSGRATGTNQIYITALVTTTLINQVLSVVNPTGNSTALTITPSAGGTHAVSANLVITQIA